MDYFICKSLRPERGYQITTVKELEGLTPGSGPFAQDRIYRKTLQEQKEGKAVTTDKEEKTTKRIIEDLDSECSETESDDNYQKILEFGGWERLLTSSGKLCGHVILSCGHMIL